MTNPPQQQLRPKRHGLGIGGLSIFGTGSCLLWTVVLIPLAIPMLIVGALMMLGVPFVKTEPFTCPACGQSDKVEPAVNVLVCPHCNLAVKRTPEGWQRVL